MRKCRKFLEIYPARQDQYEELLSSNRIWIQRTKGVGVLSAAEAIDLGLTGPALRGSGVSFDLRKASPYTGYERYVFEVPIGRAGDTYDRYLVRLEEMRQSISIVRRCWTGFRRRCAAGAEEDQTSQREVFHMVEGPRGIRGSTS